MLFLLLECVVDQKRDLCVEFNNSLKAGQASTYTIATRRRSSMGS